MSTSSPSNVPQIPDNAPFSTEQRAWLNGFLAGMFSNAPGGAAEAPVEAKPLTILFGSQTGNSETLAKQVAKASKGQGFEPKVCDMGTYEPSALSSESHVLVLTSTYGEGEPPDNAQGLYDFIHSGEAPRLEGVTYSVLSLGDSSYAEFCKCGIDFDLRFEALGAKRAYPRVDCDVDFDDDFAAWKEGALGALAEAAGAGGQSDAAAETKEEAEGYDKNNPFPAAVLNNYNLNTEASAKETRHVEFSLAGSGLDYEVGDALGVCPINCPELVQDILKILGYDGEEAVTFKAEEISLAYALSEKYDIRTLTKKVLQSYAELAQSEELNTLLSADKKELDDYLWGREVIDVLTAYPVSFESPQAFVDILGKLNPRLYSISSSPKAHPEEVHLTVGAVRYESYGRVRKGICSTYLADRVDSGLVKVYIHGNKAFKLPESVSTPVIMVGPGTGVAPFRAFLEERQASGASGKNWLFFGDQHEASDYLYREQLEGMVEAGLIQHLDTAFSRDQKEKIYVQNRMLEKGKELFQWLEEGAHFYVCGDASRMAKDVDAALHAIVEKEGNLSAEQAAEYIKKLKSEKRYARDVY